jgi:prepilin-type N-terminal cleavage/methylation domain-containing protein
MWAKQKGFTIVELLIVIVVIGILAAITMVAFTSAQARADNTRTAQAISQFTKIISTYASEHGVYPTNVVPPATPPSVAWTCLPYTPSTCGSSSNTPSSCFGLNTTGMNSAFIAELKRVASPLPAVSERSIACSATQTFQGALINVFNTGKSARLHFVQLGDVECPSIGGTSAMAKSFSADATRCSVELPTLN